MYRSRLSGDLAGSTLGYVSSMGEDAGLLRYDILGSEAHVVMLSERGLVSPEEAGAILSALEAIRAEGPGEDSGAEDIHEQVEAGVVEQAGMDAGGRMHAGRSRNDQVALDMRMRIRDEINSICDSLAGTVQALLAAAGRHKDTVMPLYTHLQRAQAGTLSHYLLAQADILLRDIDRLASAYSRVNLSPLGAGPVGGTSIPVDRERTAALLGFDGLVENSIDATSSRDFAAEYVAALAVLMTDLSRIAEDMVIWSSSEFSFIELPDELASPSSVMPQKKNPDILEITRAKAAEVIGNLAAILASVKGLATGYGRDLQQVKPLVWRSSEIALQASAIVGAAVGGMTANEERMMDAADGGYLAALDIAERLVLDGMPFRQAHKAAGLLVQAAAGLGKGLGDLSVKEIGSAVAGTSADASAVFRIAGSADAAASLRERKSAGSPRMEEQERMIRDRTEAVEARTRECAGRREKIEGALKELESEVARLKG